MKIKQLPFYFIVIAFFLGIVSPFMFSDGMFSDGVLYALISNNLANGIGSFWDLHATNTLYSHFNEHPPLAFGLQSMFFYLFGDSLLIERIYSLSTFFITGIIIIMIWRKLYERTTVSLAWLPLLLWISIPLITWSATNNMLENTMMIFISLSVLYCLKSLDSYRLLNITIAGIMLFLAFLSKGFVALFPFSFFFWFYVITRKVRFRRAIIDTLYYLIAAIVPLIIVFIIEPQSVDSLMKYFNRQIIGSISNIQTVDNRFYILFKTFKELIPMIVIAFIVFILTFKIKVNNNKSMFLLFLFLGLSGVIPIMISMKQSGFYVLATFPFFSIAIAYLIAPRITYLLSKINDKAIGYKIFKYFSILLLTISFVLVLLQINNIGRDTRKLDDIYLIIEIVKEDSTISVSPHLWKDWSLHGYFYRNASISIDDHKPFLNRYVLVSKDSDDISLVNYKKVPIILNLYDLYESK